MKYHIDHFTWKKYNKTIKEWYISNDKGVVVAGDFSSRGKAKSFLINVLIRGRK